MGNPEFQHSGLHGKTLFKKKKKRGKKKPRGESTEGQGEEHSDGLESFNLVLFFFIDFRRDQLGLSHQRGRIPSARVKEFTAHTGIKLPPSGDYQVPAQTCREPLSPKRLLPRVPSMVY